MFSSLVAVAYFIAVFAPSKLPMPFPSLHHSLLAPFVSDASNSLASPFYLLSLSSHFWISSNPSGSGS